MSMTRVHEVVADTPHMSLDQAEVITDFIEEHDAKDILELGFRFGVSTAYMADRLESLGRGHITTIDLESARVSGPGLASFLDELGLAHRVTPYYEPTSYLWRLMRMLEQDPAPRFDLCYLDGAHDWFVDGFAFFLVDRLLRPGGWIIFDDVDWTFASSPSWRASERVMNMPADERDTPHVRKIVELLVAPHPDYGPVTFDKEWAFVQKLTARERMNQRVAEMNQRVAEVTRTARERLPRAWNGLSRSR